MPARTVITRFGGIRPLAAALGHRSHTTVQGWWDRDMIPAQRQRELLDLGRKTNIEVQAADLIPDAISTCARCGDAVSFDKVSSCASTHCPQRIQAAA